MHYKSKSSRYLVCGELVKDEKPIDPNLDNILDDILTSKAKRAKAFCLKGANQRRNKNEIEETLNSSDEGEK